MPDVFVIDLTGASKAPSLVIPSAVPPSVGSVSVEEVTEMGSRADARQRPSQAAGTIDASAEGNSIVINLPAVARAGHVAGKTAPPAPKPADASARRHRRVEPPHADPFP